MIKLRELIKEEDDLKSIKDIKPLLSSIIASAQKVYDEWDQSDGEEVGGICHDIADEISSVLNNNGIEATTINQTIGEQHVYCVFKVVEGIYELDIPPNVYETGGGYNWKKKPNIKFDVNDLVINRLSRDISVFNDYLEWD